jgi:3-phosphoshikimate 1-carboxyvinyltransferase
MTDYLKIPALEIVPSGPIHAAFTAPSSKSYTNRALLLAALAEGTSHIRRPLLSDDTDRMREALVRFGAEIETEADGSLRVTGTGGRIAAPKEPIDCGLSGTTVRFLAAFASLAEGETVLTGKPPLLRRPIAPLADALERLGAGVRYLGERGCPPLGIRGPLRGGAARVDASQSSQFLSALLLAAPLAKEDVVLEVKALISRPYIDMTRSSVAAFGGKIGDHGEGGFVIPSNQSYRARDYETEYDASSAAHLFALAAATGGSVTVENALPETLQADARFARYLEEMGCRLERDGSRLTARGADSLRPLVKDLSDTPDMTTPLAVLCAYAEGESLLYNVEFARGHETDRLAATATELKKLGVDVTEERDGLRIAGGARRSGTISTYHDHRMAMSFAAAGARTPGIVIEDPGCVSKTFPEFWRLLEEAGIALKPAS